jgi:hypothetical protein
MISFTALELIERAKARLRRSSSDFCSPEEYRTLCDVAWRRCYNRTARKFPSYYSADATIAIEAGRLKYTLPATFRSLQLCSIEDGSGASSRPIRPLTELMLRNLTTPETTARAFLRYVPEPVRVPSTVDGDAVSLVMPVAADEWIVNCICRMVVTKEGTDRSAYDMDFAMLDAELETYAGDFDLGWPIDINEVFPGNTSAYGIDVQYTGNLVAGYILRGLEIEFWSLRAPGL